MATTAALHTFATPELLELILLQLPERAILLAQQVCRSWKSLITTSPMLQTALYFRAPVSTGTLSQDYKLNPIMTSAFPFLFSPQKTFSPEQCAEWDRRFSNLSPAPRSNPYASSPPRPFFYSDWIFNERAWRRAEASWRNMFVSIPLIKRLVFVRHDSGMMGNITREAIACFGDQIETEGVKERGWIKRGFGVASYEMDLQKEKGLRWGLLHDFLYLHSCTGDSPGGWSMKLTHKYTSLAAADNGKKDEAVSDVNERAGGRQETDALTLVIGMGWTHDCILSWEQDHPQFCSAAYESVEIGPWVADKHTWLYDSGDEDL